MDGLLWSVVNHIAGSRSLISNSVDTGEVAPSKGALSMRSSISSTADVNGRREPGPDLSPQRRAQSKGRHETKLKRARLTICLAGI